MKRKSAVFRFDELLLRIFYLVVIVVVLTRRFVWPELPSKRSCSLIENMSSPDSKVLKINDMGGNCISTILIFEAIYPTHLLLP